MKNLKLGFKFFIIFISASLIPMILLNILDISTGKEVMRAIQSHVLQEKLVGDLYSIEMYIENELGNLKISEGKLYGENGNLISEDEALLDEISENLGIVATVFTKDDTGYCRQLTSVIDEETGERLINTYLAEDSPVYDCITKSEEYIGVTDIQGTSYTTAYRSIVGQDGENIGILFVGVSMNESNVLLNSELDTLAGRMWMISVFMWIIGLVTMRMISATIIKPVRSIDNESNRVAKLNLTQPIEAHLMERKDEVGELARSIESIQENLRMVISSSEEISQKVSKTSTELASTCAEASQVTEEMAHTIQEVAQGATEQAQNTSSCMQQLEHLGQLIDEEQIHITALDKTSNHVAALADEGSAILEHVVNIINNSNEAAAKVCMNMQKTDQSAKQISEASNVIASIAKQTNLLALNASIEAARAGEHGKGFAVVAEAIRSLAEQSAHSTKMIDEQIMTLQKDVQAVVEVTGEVRGMLEEQNEGIKLTKSKYLDITKAIEDIKVMSDRLAQSSLIMTQEKNAVSGNVEALSAVAQENAAAAEESSACIEEQSAALHDMHTSSNILAEMAEELHKLLLKFQIR